MAEDVTTVGLSESAHATLQSMKDVRLIAEMRDGYRLAIAVALAKGLVADAPTKTKTFLNVGSLDQDGSLRNVLQELFPDESRPYALAERLAEAGMGYIGPLFEAGQFRISELVPEEA